MKIVVQRVSRARVEVGDRIVGQIAEGILVLLGITHSDGESQADWLVEKIINLRIFEDQDGKMNKSLKDIGGGLLIVSQFTLYADCKKGARPSFVSSAHSEHAELIYNYFVGRCIDTGLHIETGEFGEHMYLDIVNDGPVTLLLDK